MSSSPVTSDAQTLSFDQFWNWVQKHPNCILRAGSGDAVIFDHDDHHWFFGIDHHGGVLYVQCFRGKRVIAEISIHPGDVVYVRSHLDQDEWFFDLLDDNHQVLHYFVLSHRYEEAEAASAAHLN